MFRRVFLGLIAFVTLVLLYLAGQRAAAPAVAPQPAPTDCPPPTTITLPPPETGAATHAAWLRRGAPCDSVHVVEG
ncbi:hypothetical protein [Amycolatopsis sp. La24]|uniref:hypothetical protein n=1 Tax=Amycolatopsis sp. La24 TaxID=3028304 RepID=UPI0023B1D1D1|nr:hypothetical protein [Amycolatopsis sp. La24]